MSCSEVGLSQKRLWRLIMFEYEWKGGIWKTVHNLYERQVIHFKAEYVYSLNQENRSSKLHLPASYTWCGQVFMERSRVI
jgi:hypothetical protein